MSDYYPSTHLNAGRLATQTDPNGKKTYFDYTARGEPQHMCGDVPYLVERKYSAFGKLARRRLFPFPSRCDGATARRVVKRRE